MNDGVAAMLAELNAGFPAVEDMTATQARAAVAARRHPCSISTTWQAPPIGSSARRRGPCGYGSTGRTAPRPRCPRWCSATAADSCSATWTVTTVSAGSWPAIPNRWWYRSTIGWHRRHPAPAAAEDAVAAFCWVVATAHDLGVDAARVAVAGDSAGGNLAAVTAVVCRERGLPMPAAQILLYPVIDPAGDSASYRTRGDRVHDHRRRHALVLAKLSGRQRACPTPPTSSRQRAPTRTRACHLLWC